MNRVARAVVGVFVSTFGLLSFVTFSGNAAAQQAQQHRPPPANAAVVGNLPDREALNSGTVTVITAPIGGPMSVMGSDMAAVLDEGENLRVLPILGKGSAQNLVDIIMLKNID
ncbi:hypothetical protein G3V71_24155, partial [Escherichia coli]|nr:hypothetical protein [Escherichia coli]